MKNVKIILQNKGGVGKSFLSALVLKKKIESEANFVLVDIDSGNRSNIKRFKGTDFSKHIVEFSLIKGETIEKGLFSALFEQFAKLEKDEFILDLGGNESRELITLFKSIGIEDVVEFFNDLELNVELLVVMRVNDKDCYDFYSTVNNVVENKISTSAMINGNSFDDVNDPTFVNLKKTLEKDGTTVKPFGTIPTGEPRTRISNFIGTGFSSNLGMFKGMFKRQYTDLEV